ERVLAVFERESDPEGIYVTYPLSCLGVSYMGVGRFAEAVPPLERAVRIREAKETLPAKLAHVHFALARALWGAGRDLPPALSRSGRAARHYSPPPRHRPTQRDLPQIERWLASRGGPPPLASDETEKHA